MNDYYSKSLTVNAESILNDKKFINGSTIISNPLPYITTSAIINEDDVKRLFKEMFNKTKPSFFKLTCQNCGASVEQKIDDHLFKCPYCNSVYYIGMELVNS